MKKYRPAAANGVNGAAWLGRILLFSQAKNCRGSLECQPSAWIVHQAQGGVIDAIKGVDPEAFSATLNKGVETAHAAGADVILMNTQYSPRTESTIALSAYLENMHWVALQREVPLFDRFGIMELWSELGTFHFFSAT